MKDKVLCTSQIEWGLHIWTQSPQYQHDNSAVTPIARVIYVFFNYM